MFKEIFIDVSELEAPEPYTKITRLMEKIDGDSYLRIKHRMEPFPLYEVLEQAGYDFCAVKVKNSSFNILIWLSGSEQLTTYCQSLKKAVKV